MGDDVAVLPPPSGKHQLLTNDSLVFGRHFDDTASAAEASAKLLKRNLSDIAAKGGTPRHALIALCCGPDLSLSWLEEFFRSLSETAALYGCEINGGDLAEAASGTFCSTVTLTGEADSFIPRTAGEDHSWIWVTGVLGGSILGHHLSFVPRLAEGRWLAASGSALAMMDVTDGLARDLPKMIPAGLQARLDLALVPVADGARAAAQDSGKPAVWHAFTDGEDYELLFFTRPGLDVTRFESDWQRHFKTPLAAIGTLQTAPPSDGSRSVQVVGLDGAPLFTDDGFEHFRHSS